MGNGKNRAMDAVRANAHTKPQEPSESFEVSGDEAKLKKVTRQPVRTLDDLIRECKIDTSIWHVQKWGCRKYDMGSIPRSVRAEGVDKWVRPSTKPVVTELYSVWADLVDANVHRLSQKGPRGKAEFLRQFRVIVGEDHFKVPRRPVQKLDLGPEQPEIAAVMTSNLHLCETVRPEDANGVNVYNSIIAANRLWEHSQKVKSILARHLTLYPIEKIWLPLLGDCISGSIHEEYLATNDLSDPAAVILGARLYSMFFTEIAGLNLPMEVDAVHGNHPRLTPKMPTKRQARTNYDWLIYEYLTDLLKSQADQIKMSVTTSQIGERRLFDWMYRFEHGIGVASGKEEDFEDRLRALFDDPVYRDATKHRGASFDQVVIGNMHKPKFLERTVVNGSYIGQNELGQSWRLKPIRAQQLMWGIGEKRPRTWQYQLDFTDIKHERADNPFSEYTAWFLKKHGK